MGQEIDSENENISNRKQIRKKVILLSVFYLLVVVSYASFSNVVIYIHQKYRHKGYGEAYLTANSIASVIAYIICPFYLAKTNISSTKLLIASGIGYLINMLIPAIFSIVEQLSNQTDTMSPPFKFRFLCEILANMIGGVASVIFWILNGVYMTNYCEPVAANKKGRYFSLANVILNLRAIIGPALTIIGLGMGSQGTYFTVLSLTVLAALPIPMCSIPSIKIKKDEQENGLSGNDTQSTLGQPQQRPQSKWQQIISYLQSIKNISLLIPCCVVAGLMMGFVSSSLSHLFPKADKDQDNDTQISITLLLFGVGSILGGHLSGLICDKYSIRTAGYLGNFLIILSCLTQAFVLSIQPSLQNACIVGFLSGLSCSFLFCYILIICTIHYKGSASSFAITRMVNTIFYISYQWLVAVLNNVCNMKFNMTYQSLALIPIAIFAAYCIKVQCSKHIQQQEQIGISVQQMGNKSQLQVQRSS